MADESGTKAVKPLVLPPGMISSVLVQMDPGASSVAVEDAIIREVPDTRILTRASLSGTVTQHLAGITLLLHDITVIVTAIFLPVLVFVSVMLARDMKQELTILGALGATKAFVLRLILAETFSAALIGSLAGIGSALVVLFGFQDFIALSLNVPFSVPTAVDLLSAAGSTLVLTLVISGIASLYPTFRLLRSEAYGNIRTDESD
jgi:putative ABC transport system permease protein